MPAGGPVPRRSGPTGPHGQSAGPFRGRTRAELQRVTVEEALAHPTWRMGPKITVDSSTLMNKGLEVIEAHELFGVDYDRMAVIIHPQSVVHSMVEFTDGATVAQLSNPDMRLPIGYALAYPDRLHHAFGAIDWASFCRASISSSPIATSFRCLDLAEQAGRAGGLAPAWLNAANEVAVAAFLDGRVGWGAIADVVADTIDACEQTPVADAGDVIEADRRARQTGRAGRPSTRVGGVSEITETPDLAAGSDDQRRSRRHEHGPVGSPVAERRPGPTPEAEYREPKGSVVQLVAVVAAILAMSMLTHSLDLLIVIVAIIVMVMIHELGHFATAKWSHMKVTEYFLGFGPRLWSFRRGETEYGVKAIPLGGYVKIIGMTNTEEVDPADEAAHLPPAAVPQPAHGGAGRLLHALRHGLHPALVHRRLHRSASGQHDGGRASTVWPTGRPRPRKPGSSSATTSSSIDGTRGDEYDRSCRDIIETTPGACHRRGRAGPAGPPGDPDGDPPHSGRQPGKNDARIGIEHRLRQRSGRRPSTLWARPAFWSAR